MNFFKKKITSLNFLLLSSYLRIISNIYFNIFSYIKYNLSKLYNINISTFLLA